MSEVQVECCRRMSSFWNFPRNDWQESVFCDSKRSVDQGQATVGSSTCDFGVGRFWLARLILIDLQVINLVKNVERELDFAMNLKLDARPVHSKVDSTHLRPTFPRQQHFSLKFKEWRQNHPRPPIQRQRQLKHYPFSSKLNLQLELIQVQQYCAAIISTSWTHYESAWKNLLNSLLSQWLQRGV